MEVLKKISEKHNKTAALILEDGEILWGYGLGVKKAVIGELCFNTSQSGYQEALTDPSYTKQIITFTFPQIGNTGTNKDDNESEKPRVRGVITRTKPTEPSNCPTISSAIIIYGLANLQNITRLLSLQHEYQVVL